jgi:hypothetical protein
MAVSGAPGRTEEVLTGHLSDGVAKGGMLVTIYELIQRPRKPHISCPFPLLTRR